MSLVANHDGPFDLVLKLGEHNAGRRCEKCDNDAVFYYLTWDEISTYRCAEHPAEA